MKARATLFGHPIHQMLIVLPLGLLTGVVIFDVIHLLTGGEQWALIAYWLIPVGVLSGLMAAVFGVLDWSSWLLRGEPGVAPGTLALVCSFAGGGLAMMTGWLGGELVNRLGVGVEEGAHLDAPSSLSGHPARTSSSGD